MLCVAALLVTSSNVFSQSTITRHYGIEDGLSSNHVYSALQDRYGYVWLATDNGVSRFDGKRFRNFTSKDGLPDNDVFLLKEDAIGRIWLSCFNGQPCYIHKEKVYNADNDNSLKQLISEKYFRLYTFQTKIIIARGEDNFEIDGEGKLKPLAIDGLFFQPIGKYLICTSFDQPRGRFYLLDSAWRRLDAIYFPPNLKAATFSAILSVHPASTDQLLITLKKGKSLLYKIEDGHFVLSDSVFVDYPFTELYHYHNRLWANNYGKGIIPVDAYLKPDPLRPVLFKDKTILNFMVDRESNYWGCTPGEGLYLIPNNKFVYYYHEPGLKNGNVLKLAVDKNEIYCGFTNGEIEGLKDSRGYHHQADLPASLRKKINCMYADSLQIVAATADELFMVNRYTGKERKFSVDNIKCMHPGAGYILLGNPEACFRLWLHNGKIDTIFNKRTTAVYERKNGDVIAGTLRGLFLCTGFNEHQDFGHTRT